MYRGQFRTRMKPKSVDHLDIRHRTYLEERKSTHLPTEINLSPMLKYHAVRTYGE